MATGTHPPLWGNFVAHGDEDLLAFGLLRRGNLNALAFYHSTQAIEKYLKALVLALLDPMGAVETPLTQRWLKIHDLVKLAEPCTKADSFYGQPDTRAHLKRFSEFDQVSRYPWTNQDMGNGFSSEDIPVVGEICQHLRKDLPIKCDNYELGMEVRGYFHGDRTKIHPAWDRHSHEAVQALRSVLPNIEEFVRGWDRS